MRRHEVEIALEELRESILRDLKKIPVAPDPRRKILVQIARDFPEIIVQAIHDWLSPANAAGFTEEPSRTGPRPQCDHPVCATDPFLQGLTL